METKGKKRIKKSLRRLEKLNTELKFAKNKNSKKKTKKTNTFEVVGLANLTSYFSTKRFKTSEESETILDKSKD